MLQSFLLLEEDAEEFIQILPPRRVSLPPGPPGGTEVRL